MAVQAEVLDAALGVLLGRLGAPISAARAAVFARVHAKEDVFFIIWVVAHVYFSFARKDPLQ